MADIPRHVEVIIRVKYDPERLVWQTIGRNRYASLPFDQSVEMDTYATDDVLHRALVAAVRAIEGTET